VNAGLLFDSTRCIGCGACSAACKEANGLPLPIEDRTTAYLQDQGGLNKTRLNGRPLQKLSPLADGDQVRVGDVELVVSISRG